MVIAFIKIRIYYKEKNIVQQLNLNPLQLNNVKYNKSVFNTPMLIVVGLTLSLIGISILFWKDINGMSAYESRFHYNNVLLGIIKLFFPLIALSINNDMRHFMYNVIRDNFCYANHQQWPPAPPAFLVSNAIVAPAAP